MPRGHHVCHWRYRARPEGYLSFLFRGLGASHLFPCWLSVEVLALAWGDCCLTVEVAVCVMTIIKLGLVS